MDAKIALVNGDIEKTIYMEQQKFECKDLKYLIFKLKMSIYGLKQTSRELYQ